MLYGKNVAIDLGTRLHRVASIDKKRCAIVEHHRGAGRACKACNPGQAFFARGQIFVLLAIGAWHHESVEPAPLEFASQFRDALRRDAKAAVRTATKADVPLLYWTGVSWGAAISLSKDNPDLVADQPIVEALIGRALELDEKFDSGAIHSFLITYEASRPGVEGDFAMRSRKHFDRAMELSGGYLAGPLVSLAEAVSVQKQDRKEFQSLLERAVAIDVNARPELRLANLVMQRRARWLLARVDELFLEVAQ